MNIEICMISHYAEVGRKEVETAFETESYGRIAKLAHEGALKALERLGNLIVKRNKISSIAFELKHHAYSADAKALIGMANKYNDLYHEQEAKRITDQIEYEFRSLPVEEDDEEEEFGYEEWRSV